MDLPPYEFGSRQMGEERESLLVGCIQVTHLRHVRKTTQGLGGPLSRGLRRRKRNATLPLLENSVPSALFLKKNLSVVYGPAQQVRATSDQRVDFIDVVRPQVHFDRWLRLQC